MWPLQLTYSPQLLAKYIQSQNINPTNKCFPIVGRINTITIYIYIFNFNIFPQCIYLYWIYSGNNYMLYLRVSLFCKTVFVTSGSQFSRGPICRTNIFQGPNLPGPDLPGPNLPPRGPICRGPICRGPICHHQIFRGPICRTQNFPGPNLPGPNLPGPNLPGPNLPQKSLGAQFARGPI